jgi:hypothetical protein
VDTVVLPLAICPKSVVATINVKVANIVDLIFLFLLFCFVAAILPLRLQVSEKQKRLQGGRKL